MTVRRGAIPALLAGALVAAAAVASGGLLALLAVLPPLLIAFTLFIGRSAGVDALVELAEALSGRRPRERGNEPHAATYRDFFYLPLSTLPLLGGSARRGPPFAHS